jgi:hypothetical protein
MVFPFAAEYLIVRVRIDAGHLTSPHLRAFIASMVSSFGISGSKGNALSLAIRIKISGRASDMVKQLNNRINQRCMAACPDPRSQLKNCKRFTTTMPWRSPGRDDILEDWRLGDLDVRDEPGAGP